MRKNVGIVPMGISVMEVFVVQEHYPHRGAAIWIVDVQMGSRAVMLIVKQVWEFVKTKKNTVVKKEIANLMSVVYLKMIIKLVHANPVVHCRVQPMQYVIQIAVVREV